MAWCQSCDRYLTPATLTVDGACPSCHSEVDHPQERLTRGAVPRPAAGACRAAQERLTRGAVPSGAGSPADTAPERIPWHFWLLLAAATAYLGWRAVQGAALLLTVSGIALPLQPLP